MTDLQQAINTVAPHAGAWIETRKMDLSLNMFGSRPTRARGLKQTELEGHIPSVVAPHAGAWIETRFGNSPWCA